MKERKSRSRLAAKCKEEFVGIVVSQRMRLALTRLVKELPLPDQSLSEQRQLMADRLVYLEVMAPRLKQMINYCEAEARPG